MTRMVGVVRETLGDAIGLVALCVLIIAIFSTPLLKLPAVYEAQYHEVRK